MDVFQRKTSFVEAIQWTNEPDQFSKILNWGNGKITSASPLVWKKDVSLCLEVKTPLMGLMLVNLDDWIIKEGGGYYACKPENFEASFDNRSRLESNTAAIERLLREIPMEEWPKFLRYEESRLSHAAMTVLVYLRPNDVKVDFDKEGKTFKVQIGATGKELTVWNEQLDVAFMDTIRETMAKAFYKQPNEL